MLVLAHRCSKINPAHGHRLDLSWAVLKGIPFQMYSFYCLTSLLPETVSERLLFYSFNFLLTQFFVILPVPSPSLRSLQSGSFFLRDLVCV